MKGQTAIVTGGGKGIGKAICIALAKEGANVVINYSSSSTAAEETAEACRAFGVSAVTVKGNVAVFDDCQNIVKTATENFGKVDILVNNAGITKDNLLMKMSPEDYDAVIDVNLKGTFNMMQSVSRLMLKQKSGRIINIASVVGLIGNAGQVNYCASKAGVIGMTKAFAREVGGRNITVNAIAPGFIETDMTHELSEGVRTAMMAQIPQNRFGSPDDVADAVAFLASDKAKYITGQTLSVDGGMCMH